MKLRACECLCCRSRNAPGGDCDCDRGKCWACSSEPNARTARPFNPDLYDPRPFNPDDYSNHPS